MTIGIDEVGRGPLAGPVFVAVLALPESVDLKKSGLPLRDSKKLTEAERMAWCVWIKTHSAIRYEVAKCAPKTIDSINITQAANRAAQSAHDRLIKKIGKGHAGKALLDYGIRLDKEVPQEMIVKGDEKVPAIALASIMAKVARDAYMDRLGKRLPQYGFAENKGYGTKRHIEALKRYGPCPEHRLTFIANFCIVKPTHMGGVPVKHHSKGKVGRRRSHLAMKKTNMAACAKCKGPVMPHRACAQCGVYKKRAVKKKAA